MSESLHKRRSSMRTRNCGVGTYHKLMNKLRAFENGKRVMETVPNPKSKNRPFTRKPMERD